MSQAGFEHAFPASERPNVFALDSAATGICSIDVAKAKYYDIL